MELRLFNRGKDIRFVRPHRIAFLEWFRAVRHNMFREITLMMDKLKGRTKSTETMDQEKPLQNELFPENPRERFQQKLRELLNGKRAALSLKEGWHHLRTNGVKQVFWPFLFMFGLVIGFGVKSWAENHITIGYEDYKIQSRGELYDLNALKIKVQNEQANPTVSNKKVYPACNIEQ